jgi:hypothetical protein
MNKGFHIGARVVVVVSEFPINLNRVCEIVGGPHNQYVMAASELPVTCWSIADGKSFDGYDAGGSDESQLICAHWQLRLLDDDEKITVDERGIEHAV